MTDDRLIVWEDDYLIINALLKITVVFGLNTFSQSSWTSWIAAVFLEKEICMNKRINEDSPWISEEGWFSKTWCPPYNQLFSLMHIYGCHLLKLVSLHGNRCYFISISLQLEMFDLDAVRNILYRYISLACGN